MDLKFLIFFSLLISFENVEGSTEFKMFDRVGSIDNSSWHLGSLRVIPATRTYKQCAANCVKSSCSAFEFSNNVCTIGMPDELIQFNRTIPIFTNTTVWIDLEEVSIKHLPVCSSLYAGKQCVFPYLYHGVKKNHCTGDSANEGPWCPIATNPLTGEMALYAQCGDSCFSDAPVGCTTRGKKACIFPFKRNGTTYTKCSSIPWNMPYGTGCSTQVDANGVHVEGSMGVTYDYCWTSCLS